MPRSRPAVIPTYRNRRRRPRESCHLSQKHFEYVVEPNSPACELLLVLFVDSLRHAADLGGPGERAELQFSLLAEGLMPLRNPRMGISITLVCCLRESGRYPSRHDCRMDLANQERELIGETLPVTGHRFWTLGQGGIYFVDARNEPAVLKFIDLTSRKLTVWQPSQNRQRSSPGSFRFRLAGVTHCTARTMSTGTKSAW